MLAVRALAALALLGAAPAQRYAVDAAASDVTAKVAFFGLASKTARFPAVSGGITLAPGDPEQIDLIVTLDARALTAPDRVTLARLKGPAFFDVERYPIVQFRGERMRLTGELTATIAGQITARGVTRPATLKVRFASPPLSADGRDPLRLDGETVIDRRDFGMTAYPLIVGQKVKIRIRAVLVPA